MKEKHIGGIEYIPVDKVACGNQKHVILPTKIIKHIVVIDIDSKNYIPLKSIPKKYIPFFKPRKLPLNVIIKIENEHYGPTNKKNLTKITIGGVKYIPVSKAQPSSKTFIIYPPSDYTDIVVIQK